MKLIRFLSAHSQLTVCILLAILVTGAYWQVIGGEFVNYDDFDYVTQNPAVNTGLSLHNVIWAFTTPHSTNWHPLTWISHMVDCQFYGLNPAGHHVTNLVLHVLSTLLLFLILRRMTGSVWRSALVAALFGLHPLHVESVAWVAERKDVLSGLFWILTMWAYVWYTQKPAGRRYALVALIYALGLMAKPMLVTLPLALLLIDFWPLRRTKAGALTTRGLVVEKLPLFALAAASSVVTFLVQRSSGAVTSVISLPLAMRAENAIVAYCAYIGKMLWPARLAVIYPHSHSYLPVWQVAGCLLALVGVTVLAIRARKIAPFATVGWFWYLITLIPVIGLVQVGEQSMADRYTYLPFIGLFVAIAWATKLLSDLLRRSRAPVAAAFAVILIFSLLTWRQVGYWHDSISLFEHTLDCTDGNYVAHSNLAAALEARGDVDGAISHYEQSVEIMPAYIPAQINYGNLLTKQGRLPEAADHYKIALQFDPNDAKSHYNLGMALQRTGRLDQAMEEYKEAIRLKPAYTSAIGSLGNVLVALKRLDEAEAQYKKVLRIDPNDAVAKRNLTAIRDHKSEILGGDSTDQARQHYRTGMDLARQGQPDAAVAEYRKALGINPRLADAHCNIGVILATQGRADEAVAEYTEALSIDPKHFEAQLNLAAALGSQGKFDEAIEHFRKAAQIKPERSEVHSNLALALFMTKDYEGAWKEVHLCRKYGGTPNEAFVQDLSSKMSDPGR